MFVSNNQLFTVFVFPFQDKRTQIRESTDPEAFVNTTSQHWPLFTKRLLKYPWVYYFLFQNNESHENQKFLCANDMSQHAHTKICPQGNGTLQPTTSICKCKNDVVLPQRLNNDWTGFKIHCDSVLQQAHGDTPWSRKFLPLLILLSQSW